MRKLILYIAASIDGYIAKPNDNLDFLKVVEKEGEDYGYATFTESVDTIIIGRRTFDWVINQIGKDHYFSLNKQIIVITTQSIANEGNIEYYSGPILSLIEQLKSSEGKNIYCEGGAILVHELLKHHLIDELYLSVVPVLLGEGIPLFQEGRPELLMKLNEVKTFDTGLVQLHYSKL